VNNNESFLDESDSYNTFEDGWESWEYYEEQVEEAEKILNEEEA